MDSLRRIISNHPLQSQSTIPVTVALCTIKMTTVQPYKLIVPGITEMYVDDIGHFWEYKVRVKSDINALTFATNGAVPNEAYECDVTIDGGKILLGAATTPHGTPADSIVYYISFSDDEPGMRYKVSGYRYTGLAVDD